MGQLVVAKRYLDKPSADIGRSLLAATGIQAFVFTDNEGSAAPHLSVITGVRLMVHADDLVVAQEALASVELTIVPDPDADADAAADAPAKPSAFAVDVRRAYVAAVFGTFVLPVVAHLYSLWLIGSRILPHCRNERVMPPFKVWVSLVFDGVVLGLVIALFRPFA